MKELSTSKLIIILFGKKNQSNEIETSFVKSEDQLADVFTKGLDPGPFYENVDKLGMFDIYNPNLRKSVEK
jgi:hypothetical protein